MTAISSNSTAASALSLLTGSTRTIEKTTTQIATGKAIGQASDNAAYWSIATAMRSTGMAMTSAQDASGLAAATAETAALGVAAAGEIVSTIQSKLILARSGGVDKNAVNAEITQLKEQLVTVTGSASFSGQNWLNNGVGQTPQVTSLVASVSSGASGNTTINTIEFDTAETVLTSSNDANDGLLTKAYSGTTEKGIPYDYYLVDTDATTPAPAAEIEISDTTTNDELDGMISATSAMLSGMADAGAKLGATSNRIAYNNEFITDLKSVIDIGVGRLVDADMEESLVKLSAAKAQQQLQLIGLNIANDQSKAILSLFL